MENPPDLLPLLATLGRVLKRLRRDGNLRLRDVQSQSGVSIGYVSAVERGKSSPSLQTIFKIASVYHTSLAKIFEAVEGELTKDERPS